MSAVGQRREVLGRGPERRTLLRIELRETLRLAIPLALTQLGQIAMMTTDLMLIGRLGTDALAAASLGQTIGFMTFVFGMGLVSAVAPLCAQAFGARDAQGVRNALRVGLWATLIVSIPLTAMQLAGETILLWFGQKPASAALAGDYLHGLAWSLCPGLAFIAIRGFMGAVNRPAPGLWVMLAAVPANALLAYALIHGAFGLPRWELFGAGIATAIVTWLMALASAALAYVMTPFREFRVFAQLSAVDWAGMRRLAAIGLPISAAFLLEYGLFAAAALLMGLISTAAVAAHQIALQIAAVLFMGPFGIGQAATVRVGQAIGRGDGAAVARAGFVAIAISAAAMALATLCVLAARGAIAGIFLGPAADSELAQLTAMLLVIGATFFVADGIQTTAAGALRGMSDTRVPMAIAAASYWAIGFAAAWALAFRTALGALGVWVGLSLGTAVFALALTLRFAALSRRARDAPLTAGRIAAM